ncbi:potassium transporter TrkG [Candidatus Nitrosarchaeum limnium]|uniref:CBS domain protein n=1 Tax=Candidatus Nitrosarchaeum limnium BG20 TaxID=859192 RepID=S2EBG0_9ARCH|nr:potassium transporter TrkG [Candidatus Nitrosarchaeum limnium]EPA06676.1 CBS domain protein [Candidatus Nitrosarchaeum limnium BG20]
MSQEKNLTDYLSKKVSQYYRTNVLMLSEHVKITEACTILKKKDVDEIIVVDDSYNPIGIVTDEDILTKLSESLVNPLKTTLGDIMVFPVITIGEDHFLSEALEIMREKKIRKIAVLSKSNLVVGILYLDTIVNLVKKSLVKQQKQSTLWGVVWNLGVVTQFTGVLMFIPGIIATLLNDPIVATGIYVMSVLLIVSGFFMNSYGEKQPITLRGTAILVFASFMILVLFGMIPQLFVIHFDTNDPVKLFADAFFESSAGFTTGGYSLVEHPEELPRSFTFYRGYAQFVGGLSFIYLIVTVFYPEKRVKTMKGFISGNVPHLKELFSIITIIFSIYAVIIALALFYLGGGEILDDFALAFSALSTGGTSPDSKIFDGFTTPEYIVMMIAMILGSLPFGFHYAFVRTKFLSINLTKEVIVYLILLVIFCTIFTLSMDGNSLKNTFNMISASTTTGFATMNMDNLSPVAYTIMIIAMIIGGCGFSTAGGIKIFRFMQLAKLRYIFDKNSVKISESDKKDIVVGLIILGVSIIIPLLVAAYMHTLGYDFQDAFFDGVSAITTTGHVAGTVSAALNPFITMVFGFLMILGRIEIILLVYMFVPKLMK